MATATLSDVLAADVAEPDVAAIPVWWRRTHTYGLAAAVAFNIGLICVLMALNRRGIGSGRWLDEVTVATMFAECYLLGLWAALGGLRVLARWGLVSLVYVIGVTLSVACMEWMAWPSAAESLVEAILMGLVGALLFTGFALGLVPLRGLLGWRIDFDPIFYRHVRSRRGQVGLMDYAAYSCCVAGPLTLVRLLDIAEPGMGAELLPIVIALLLLMVGNAGTITYLLLTPRPVWLALLLSLSATIAMSYIHSWFGALVEDLSIFGSSAWWLGLQPAIAMFHAAIAAVVAGTLVPLKCLGLRLIVVGRVAS